MSETTTFAESLAGERRAAEGATRLIINAPAEYFEEGVRVARAFASAPDLRLFGVDGRIWAVRKTKTGVSVRLGKVLK